VALSNAVTIADLCEHGAAGLGAAMAMLAVKANKGSPDRNFHGSFIIGDEELSISKRTVPRDAYGNAIVTKIREMPSPCTIELFLDALASALQGPLTSNSITQCIANVRQSVISLRQSSGMSAGDQTWRAVDQQYFARFQADLTSLSNAIITDLAFFRKRNVGVQFLDAARVWIANRSTSNLALTHLLTHCTAPPEFGQTQISQFRNAASASQTDQIARAQEEALEGFKRKQAAALETEQRLARIAELQRLVDEADARQAEVDAKQAEAEQKHLQQQSELETARRQQQDAELAARYLQNRVDHSETKYNQLFAITADQAEYIKRLQTGHTDAPSNGEWISPEAPASVAPASSSSSPRIRTRRPPAALMIAEKDEQKEPKE
jgi:hypothetical protein